VSKDWQQDVLDFHKAVGAHVEQKPKVPDDCAVRELRCELIKEELVETLHALKRNDLEGIADGIADSIVVLLGTAVSYGLDMRPVWDEVHRSNMSKVGGPIRSDGKQLKPVNWSPPRVWELIQEQQE